MHVDVMPQPSDVHVATASEHTADVRILYTFFSSRLSDCAYSCYVLVALVHYNHSIMPYKANNYPYYEDNFVPGVSFTNCQYFAFIGEWVLQRTCLSMCMYASVHAYTSETTCLNFNKFSTHATYGRGLILLFRRCDALCTSGFVDDVIFLNNGQEKATRKGRILKLTHRGQRGFDTLQSLTPVIGLLAAARKAMLSAGDYCYVTIFSLFSGIFAPFMYLC